MNPKTGEIRVFDHRDKLQRAMASGKWTEIQKIPDHNCKDCYGRGYTGYDTIRKRYILCWCVK